MNIYTFSSLLLFLGVSFAQQLRYEPLRNRGRDEDASLWSQGTDTYVRAHGLSFEWLEVPTQDDVTIRVHHLWNPRVNGTMIPVLMAHSLLVSGDVFLLNKPEQSFAMILANNGYDVYIINFRGSSYSPLTRDEFVNSTLDDNIFKDFPATIDFVLQRTNQETLNIVAYSKGAYVSLGLLANKPEYNQKVRLLILMCPVTAITKPVALISSLMGVLEVAIKTFGIPLSDIVDSNFYFGIFRLPGVPRAIDLLGHLLPIGTRCVYNALLTGTIDCISPLNFDIDLIEKVFIRGVPDGVKTRELIQFTQNSRSEQFQSYSPSWYDRSLGNILGSVPEALAHVVYVRENLDNVEEYDLSAVTAPVAILQANHEVFSQPQDYRRIRNSLCSNIIGGRLNPDKYVFAVTDPNFAHTDPTVGTRSDEVYGNAFYMIMRENDLSLDSSQGDVLGYLDPDFSHLASQTCESSPAS
ncbi:gastric triacylglycerol lipase [Galendromus occidentalis]|uniref:Gastric triacylglycerol lipase n=1 Tax=Galendromus occidentalis TaxID=34638 RepID=A0AAJ6QYZ4_9ACAR|nr:gastric triacylglycerol lipase [Galendromus occidentalis]